MYIYVCNSIVIIIIHIIVGYALKYDQLPVQVLDCQGSECHRWSRNSWGERNW